jgi:hypothetical protein
MIIPAGTKYAISKNQKQWAITKPQAGCFPLSLESTLFKQFFSLSIV